MSGRREPGVMIRQLYDSDGTVVVMTAKLLLCGCVGRGGKHAGAVLLAIAKLDGAGGTGKIVAGAGLSINQVCETLRYLESGGYVEHHASIRSWSLTLPHGVQAAYRVGFESFIHVARKVESLFAARGRAKVRTAVKRRRRVARIYRASQRARRAWEKRIAQIVQALPPPLQPQPPPLPPPPLPPSPPDLAPLEDALARRRAQAAEAASRAVVLEEARRRWDKTNVGRVAAVLAARGRSPTTAKMVMEATGLAENSARNALYELAAAGRAVRIRDGVFAERGTPDAVGVPLIDKVLLALWLAVREARPRWPGRWAFRRGR